MATTGQKLDRAQLEEIAATFKVFSDATRLAIIQSLREGEKTPGELVAELGTTQANISKHLRVMHDCELVARRQQAQRVYYSIDDEIVGPLCELVCGRVFPELLE